MSDLKKQLAELRDSIYEQYKVGRDIPLKQRHGNPPHFYYNKALGVQAAMELVEDGEYRKAGTCVWTHDGDTEMYETGCDTAFYFDEGDLLDNNCHFCLKCGDKIEVKTMLNYNKNGLSIDTRTSQQITAIEMAKELNALKDENAVLLSVIRHLERNIEQLEVQL